MSWYAASPSNTSPKRVDWAAAHDSVEVKSDGTVKIDGVAYTSDDLPYPTAAPASCACPTGHPQEFGIIRRLDAHYDFRDDGGQRDANQGVLVVRRPIDRR